MTGHTEAAAVGSSSPVHRLAARGAGQAGMREIARRTISRGEAHPDAVTETRLEAGHALVRHHFVTRGTPIPDEVLVEITDEVLIPLLHS